MSDELEPDNILPDDKTWLVFWRGLMILEFISYGAHDDPIMGTHNLSPDALGSTDFDHLLQRIDHEGFKGFVELGLSCVVLRGFRIDLFD